MAIILDILQNYLANRNKYITFAHVNQTKVRK